MLFYFIWGGGLILITYFSKILQLKVGKCELQVNTLSFVYILLALFIGLRDCLGFDDQMYITCFEQIKSYGYTWRNIEKIFVLISKFAISIGATYQFIFLIFSCASCVLLYRVNSKLVNEGVNTIFIAIFLSFCLLDSLTLMRQFLAMCLTCYFYIEIKEEKKIKAIILAIMAFFVHKASLIVLVVYILIPTIKKLNAKVKIFILFLLYLLQFIPVAKFIQYIVTNTFLDKYYYLSFYLGSRVDYRLFDNKIGIVTTAYLILFCLIILQKEKQNNQNISSCNKYDDDLSTFSFIYFALLMLFSQFGYATRIAYYFSIFAIAYISNNVLIVIKEDNRKYARMIFNLVLLLLFIYSIYNNCDTQGNRLLIPYRINFNLFN